MSNYGLKPISIGSFLVILLLLLPMSLGPRHQQRPLQVNLFKVHFYHIVTDPFSIVLNCFWLPHQLTVHPLFENLLVDFHVLLLALFHLLPFFDLCLLFLPLLLPHRNVSIEFGR